jgi:acyl-CoA dehydrogenase
MKNRQGGAVTQLETFRAETRAWFDEDCPGEMRKHGDVAWGGRNAHWSSADQQFWMQRMAEKGWTVPTWPRDFGGTGLFQEEDKVLKQE